MRNCNKSNQSIDRRSFLKALGGAGVAAFALPSLATCSSDGRGVLLQGGGPEDAGPQRDGLRWPSDVRVYGFHDLGGLEGIGQSAVYDHVKSADVSRKTVFIKPNWVGLASDRMWHGSMTKTDLIIGAARACLDLGAARVVIGEGDQNYVPAWDHATVCSRVPQGSTSQLCAVVRPYSHIFGWWQLLPAGDRSRVSLVQLNASSPTWAFLAPSSPRTHMQKLAVSSLVADADVIISAAPLKTHHACRVTLTMKNFVGVTPLQVYGNPRLKLHQDPAGNFLIDDVIVDLTKVVSAERTKKFLAIIDATIGVEGNGPSVHKPTELGTQAEDPAKRGYTVDVRQRYGDYLVLAGLDPVAVDATACRLIGFEPERDICHVKKAAAALLGQAANSAIPVSTVGTVRGKTMRDLVESWNGPTATPWKHCQTNDCNESSRRCAARR